MMWLELFDIFVVGFEEGKLSFFVCAFGSNHNPGKKVECRLRRSSKPWQVNTQLEGCTTEESRDGGANFMLFMAFQMGWEGNFCFHFGGHCQIFFQARNVRRKQGPLSGAVTPWMKLAPYSITHSRHSSNILVLDRAFVSYPQNVNSSQRTMFKVDIFASKLDKHWITFRLPKGTNKTILGEMRKFIWSPQGALSASNYHENQLHGSQINLKLVLTWKNRQKHTHW